MRTRFLAAAAGVLAAAALLAAPGAHASTPVNRVCIGANRGVYDAFHAAVPDSFCVRTYYDTPDVFPSVWPQSVPPGTWQMISIRPSYTALLDGSEDAQIHNLCLTGPPHSLLTIWQENAGANPVQYPADVHNAGHYVAMQKKMESLCAGTPTRFGVLIIAPFGSVLNWLYKGDDWFGYDFYAFPRYLNPNGTINVTAVGTRMTNNLKTVQSFTGRRCPPMYLGETNAAKDSQRKTWFDALTAWFGHHDCNRTGVVLTRWTDCTPGSPHCGLSGPWPPSKTVVAELNHLASQYR